MVLYVVALGAAGVLQGLALLDPEQPFQASVAAADAGMWLRSLAGVIITAGHLVFVYHALKLALSGRARALEQPPFFFIRPVLVRSSQARGAL